MSSFHLSGLHVVYATYSNDRNETLCHYKPATEQPLSGTRMVFCPFWLREDSYPQKYVFYLLEVLFSVLYVASTPESELILETTFELRSRKGNQSVIKL